MTRPRWTVLAVLLALVPPVAAAGPGGQVVAEPPPEEAAEAARLDFDRIFAEHAGGRTPTHLRWSPDGRRLTYLWEEEAGEALWLLDLDAEGPLRLLALGEGEGADLASVSNCHWSPDGAALLLESAGDLYLLRLADRELTRLTETGEEEKDPKFSPAGGRVAFVRGADLHLLELATGSERALTTDGRENEILNGVTDWVYWEEIWSRDSTGYWWSPTGDRIAYYRFDESPVRTYPLVDFLPTYPTVEWQKYPKAGEANPLVRVGVLELAGGGTVWLDTGEETEHYLARVDWLPGGAQVAVQRLNREQDRLELLRCDAATGGCATLLTETWPTWVNLTLDLEFLADGSFLWTSERTGRRRLYRYDAAGRLEGELSPPGWSLTAVDGLAEESGAVFYTAYSTASLGALYRVGFRQDLDGGPPRRVTPAEAWSSLTPAPDGRHFVHHWSDAATPPRMAVRAADGAEVAALPGEAPRGIDAAALPAWELLTIPGPEGVALPAALLVPPERDPAATHPAIMYHYGGPGSQVVTGRWDGGSRGLWHRMMAQRGYVVLMVDNAASTFFGKEGEDRAHRRFGPTNLAAQKAGVEYLRSLGYVDPARIGLWGWSGGGTHTLLAMLGSPGTWKAGVSGAPVTDWRLYDTIWTERYLDHPDNNTEGYEASSPVTYAAELRDHLLLVHGTGDDNVHPQNTLVMTRKLLDAGRPFELAIHPGQKHGFRSADARQFYERMTGFFTRHLGGPVVSTPDPPPPAPASEP